MVNIYSLTELKNASDDTIPATLAKLGYKQSHTLLDTRLILGYLAVSAAAAAGAYDYKFGFERAKGYTLIGVVLYFIFYGAMNAWQFLVERGTVYAGRKGDVEVIIKTRTEAAAPVYNVSITLRQSGKQQQPQQEKVVERHELFTKWFDVDGNLVAEPLTTWLGLIVQEAEGKDKKKNK